MVQRLMTEPVEGTAKWVERPSWALWGLMIDGGGRLMKARLQRKAETAEKAAVTLSLIRCDRSRGEGSQFTASVAHASSRLQGSPDSQMRRLNLFGDRQTNQNDLLARAS